MKPAEKAERINAARLAREDDADRARRKELDQKVQAYMREHPEARYGQLLVAASPVISGKSAEK